MFAGKVNPSPLPDSTKGVSQASRHALIIKTVVAHVEISGDDQRGGFVLQQVEQRIDGELMLVAGLKQAFFCDNGISEMNVVDRHHLAVHIDLYSLTTGFGA